MEKNKYNTAVKMLYARRARHNAKPADVRFFFVLSFLSFTTTTTTTTSLYIRYNRVLSAATIRYFTIALVRNRVFSYVITYDNNSEYSRKVHGPNTVRRPSGCSL